jgi:hypothetical protein
MNGRPHRRAVRPPWWTRTKRAACILFLTVINTAMVHCGNVEEWKKYRPIFGLIAVTSNAFVIGLSKSPPDAAVSDAAEKTQDAAAAKGVSSPA